MTDFVLPIARISYPTLFTPRLPKDPKPGAEAMYSASFLFGDLDELAKVDAKINVAQEKAYMDDLRRGVLALLQEKFGGADKVKALLQDNKLKTGFRRDIASSGLPEDVKEYIRTKSKYAPGVVDRYNDPVTRKPKVITDPNYIYAGAYVRGKVRLYTFDQDGNRGLGFGLTAVQFFANGPRIDGRKNAEDMFAGEDMPEADLGAVSGGSSSTKDELAGLLG